LAIMKCSLACLARRLSLSVLIVCLLHTAPTAMAEDEDVVQRHPVSEQSATNLPQPFKLPFKGPITAASSALYQDSPTCAQAKLALWLARGQYAFTLFYVDEPARGQEALTRDGATIIIGAEGCRVRIRIERLD
jgi:hypothetical protein